jgi:hypothetical protein
MIFILFFEVMASFINGRLLNPYKKDAGLNIISDVKHRKPVLSG